MTTSVQFSYLIKTIDDHFGGGQGGMWQHLGGLQFVLINGLILTIDLRSYDDQNSKHLMCWIMIR